MRRPVALATAAVVAAMLIPAGAAVADDGETDPTDVVDVQPVADPQQPADPQPQPDTQEQGSSTPTESTPTESTPVEPSPVTTGSGSEEDSSPTPDTPAQGDASDSDVPADTTPVQSPGQTSDGPDSSADQSAPTLADFEVTGYIVDQSGNWLAVVGQTLTAKPVHEVAGTEYSVVWYTHNGTWLANGASYTPTEGDLGRGLRLDVVKMVDDQLVGAFQEPIIANTVLAADSGAGSGSGTPDTDGPEIHDYDFTFGGFLYDDEDWQYAVVGRTLYAKPGPTWNDSWLDYDWYVGGTKVSDASTYTPRAEDIDQGIWVEIYPEGDSTSSSGIMQTLADYTIADPNAPVVPTPGDSDDSDDSDDDAGLKPMPDGWFQVDGGNGYELAYGKEYTATPTGFAPGAEYTVRWTVDGVQVGSGRTFTPAAGQIGQFVDLEFEVRAEGYEVYKSVRSAGWVQAQPTVTVSAPTISAGATATVTISVKGPAKGPQVTGPVDLYVHGNGYSVPLTGQSLENGVATYRVPNLPAGSYALTASYTGDQMWARSFSVLGASFGGYTFAQGEGTLKVVPAAATVTAPAALTVPVAMRSTFDAKVSVPGSVLPSSWTLREGGTVLGHGSTHDGRFAVTVPVLTAGTHTLVLEVPATELSAAGSATITVTVVGEPVRTGTAPSAALDTPKAATAPGQQMELVAEGFQPGETVAFYLHSDPVFLGTAVADANGIARLMATVPGDVPTGAHTVYATGGTTGRWATLAVQLAVPAPTAVTPVSAPVAAAPAAVTPAATGAGELAVTGSEGGALGLAAAFLVAVGGALVLVTRRVRATR